MLYAPHRPRLRAGPSVPLRFDKTQLPAGYFLWSDFGTAEIFDLSGSRPIAQTGTAFPFGPSAAGVGVNWAGGGTTSRLNYATFPIPAQFTMEAVLQIGTVQNENVLTFINADGADTGTFERQIAFRSTGVFAFYVFTGAINIVSGTTTFTTGDIVHVVFSYDGTTYRLYTNGNLDASSALGAAYGGYANPVLAAGFQNVATGGGGSTANQSTHVLLQAGMADRALSADEVLRRSLMPWAPMVPVQLWPRGAGSAAYTLAADAQAYQYAAGAVGLSSARTMDAAPLTYGYAAQAVGLTYRQGAHTLDVEPLAYGYRAPSVDLVYSGAAAGGTRTRRGARRIYLPEPEEMKIILPASLAQDLPNAVFDDDEDAWILLG